MKARPGHLDTTLVPYLRGELAADEQTAAAAHLAECAGCRRALDDTRAVLDALRAVPVPEPDWDRWRAELRIRLAAAGPAAGRGHARPPVAAGAPAPGRARRWWAGVLERTAGRRPAWALAAAVAAAVVLMVALPAGRHQSAPPSGRSARGPTPAVEPFDLFEDLDLIAHLDRLVPGPGG